jgi:hypothetical protein
MSRVIPNESSWIGFASSVASVSAPTAAEVAAAVDLTHYIISINAATQGNQLPTPAFDSLFETTISGTVQSSFTADFYRDDTTDTAWDTLARATDGFFIISRFGGAGTANLPVAADEVEVWPVRVTSRSMQNMASNQVMVFQVTCSVTAVPDEAATVAA